MKDSTHQLPLLPGSAFSLSQAEEYLRDSVIPLRLACNDRGGFPLVAAHWYYYDQGSLWCVLHGESRVAQRLAEDGRCAFEIAGDKPPYLGVRGQGNAALLEGQAGPVLEKLLDRYLGRRDTRLGQWLLGRKDQELVLRIQPRWITTWDYRQRMAG